MLELKYDKELHYFRVQKGAIVLGIVDNPGGGIWRFHTIEDRVIHLDELLELIARMESMKFYVEQYGIEMLTK